jgi:hypothetical protein
MRKQFNHDRSHLKGSCTYAERDVIGAPEGRHLEEAGLFNNTKTAAIDTHNIRESSYHNG